MFEGAETGQTLIKVAVVVAARPDIFTRPVDPVMALGLFVGAADERLPLTPPHPFGVEPEIFELESRCLHHGWWKEGFFFK